MVWFPASALAKCVNTTTGVVIGSSSGQPSSGQTVVCDATSPNPSSSVISATASSSNVSVTVLPGSIISPGVRAIGVVNSSTVLNEGDIRTGANNSFGITSTGSGSTLTNSGSIETTGPNGYGLDARGSNTTLINSGTITTSGDNSAGVRTTETTATTLIQNSGTINVNGTSSAADGPGILFWTGAAGTFANLAGGVVTSAADAGIRGADGNIVISNAGTLTGGNGTAIALGNGNDTIQITAGQVNGAIVVGSGNNQVAVSGGTINGNLSFGNGANTFNLIGGTINGGLTSGTGNDTLVLATGTIITGPINGGGGTNGLTLTGSGTGSYSGAITNFQNLTKQGTGSWTLTGAITGATSLLINSGTLVLPGASGATFATTLSGGTLRATSASSLGSGHVTFDGGSLQAGGSFVLANAASVNATGGTIDANGQMLAYSGVIANGTGSGGLTITNSSASPGTVTLSGANTYTGLTSITGGTLALSGLGSIASSSGVADAGTFDISGTTNGASIATLSGSGATTLGAKTVTITSGSTTYAGAASGTGGLTISGGTQILSGANTYTGLTSITGGTLALSGLGSIASSSGVADAGTFDISGTTNGASIATLSGSGATTLGAKTLTITSGSTTYAGAASGTGGLTISGGTQILSGANTYTGLTSITGGTLALSGLGSIASSSGVADAGTFDISGTTNGASIATLSGSGATTLGAKTLTITEGSTTYAGAASGTGGLTISGGTQILSGANTYTGLTSITGSTLALSGLGSIASSSGVADAGTFDISGTTNGASIATLSGSGATTLGAKTLTITAGSTTYAGAASGTGGLTISGGTQILSGANTYTGLTSITGGTLALSGLGSIASSSGVADAGTFDISGTTNGASIATLSGSGATTLGAKTVTITSGSTTYAGAASGTGGLTISGGTQILSGANTYTGLTSITGGTLALSGLGSIASSSGVADAGTFDISGTTNGASIATLSGSGATTLGAKTLTITSGSTTYAGAASGTGGLTISGGTQILSGANTYTGLTSITGGTLALSGLGSIAQSSGVADAGTFDISGTTNGASIATLTGAGHVIVGGRTLALTSAAGIFSGTIGAPGDTGGLTIAGGIQTLSGVTAINTGATTINTGSTLTLTNATNLASSSIMANGTLDVSGNGSTTLAALNGSGGATLGATTLTVSSGNFTGTLGATGDTGGLTKTGLGTFTFSGGNYSGATTIAAGTLLQSSTTANSANVAIFQGATLQTSAANVLDPNAVVNDAGTLVLNNQNQTIGSLVGNGVVQLGTGTLTYTSSGGMFSGSISGAGGFTKTGASTFTVSGTSTYSGDTNVNAGILNVTGSLTGSRVIVNSGGTLSGSGTLADPTINAGGTLAPGAVAGVPTTLTVGGPADPLVFMPASFYNVIVTPTASDRTIVNGATNINGGTVNVLAGAGTYKPQNRYNIIASAGGVTGAFAAVNSNLAFLTPTLVYDPNNVTLVLSRNDVSFAAVATTSNQRGVANGLTNASRSVQGPLGGMLLNGVFGLSATQAQAAFSALSGDGLTATQNLAHRSSELFNDAIFDQTTFYGASGGNQITLTAPQAGGFLALAPSDGIATTFRAAPPQPASTGVAPIRELADLPSPRQPIAQAFVPPQRTWRAWGSGFGGIDDIHGNTVLGSATQSNTIYGGAVGVDYQLTPNYLAGVALGGSAGDFSVANRATSGSTTGGHIAIYDIAAFGAFYGASSTSASFYQNRTTRSVAGFGGLASETERGNFFSDEFRSRLEFGRKFAGSFGFGASSVITPFVALEIAQLRTNGFGEQTISGAPGTGGFGAPGLFALNVSGQSTSSVPSYVGARLQSIVPLGNGMTFAPSLQAAFVHEFAPYRTQFGSIANLPGAVFLVDGARPARNAAQVKAGGELAIGPRTAIFANFDGEFSGVNQFYAGKGGVKILF